MASILYCLQQKSFAQTNLLNVISVFDLPANTYVEFQGPQGDPLVEIELKYKLTDAAGLAANAHHMLYPFYLNTAYDSLINSHKVTIILLDRNDVEIDRKSSMDTKDSPILR